MSRPSEGKRWEEDGDGEWNGEAGGKAVQRARGGRRHREQGKEGGTWCKGGRAAQGAREGRVAQGAREGRDLEDEHQYEEEGGRMMKRAPMTTGERGGANRRMSSSSFATVPMNWFRIPPYAIPDPRSSSPSLAGMAKHVTKRKVPVSRNPNHGSVTGNARRMARSGQLLSSERDTSGQLSSGRYMRPILSSNLRSSAE